jgi:hypothetical protein
MIISHEHKYLFIELPHTGTTAISKELRENYGGTRILRKHGHYGEFLGVATPEEREYFVFSGIRNPLDEAVSLYFKYKTDHRQRFSNPPEKGSVTRNDLKRFRFVQRTGAGFAAYFKRFYRLPFNNWSSLSHKEFDFVIHFETLQEDFARALELIGIKPVRPLPLVNKTREKEHFLTYYSPEIVGRAKRVFGPFMEEWGYKFPPEWGDCSVSWSNRMLYSGLNVLRNFYWRYVRWSPNTAGKWLRKYLRPPRVKAESRGKTLVNSNQAEGRGSGTQG